MSEEVVTVFRLVGRQEPKHPGEGHGQTRFDLLIQPMMEASDVRPQSISEKVPEALAKRESRLEAKEH